MKPETALADVASTERIRAANDAHIINTYGSRKLAFVRGEGMRLWDADGREYLDFLAGLAVVNLGHCHPAVTAAIQEQAARLVHTSNLYYIEPQTQLAEMLSRRSCVDRWFFCNSGTEANEAAIKLARRYWHEQGTPRPVIIAAEQSFHGRTLAALSATGQPKLREGFTPLAPGFRHVPYNDIQGLESACTDDSGAVMLELVQGEGGVHPATPEYIAGVARVCESRNLLLILDEVQTGIGRTGRFFAYEHYGIDPDIITLAKGLGNGVPIGALGCSERIAAGFSVGSHGCTFGGNFLSSAAAIATLEALDESDLIAHAAETGAYLRERLDALGARHGVIVDVRGRGLMIGVELAKPVAPLLADLTAHGLLCGPAGPNVLRLLPPLIVTRAEVDEAMSILDAALDRF